MSAVGRAGVLLRMTLYFWAVGLAQASETWKFWLAMSVQLQLRMDENRRNSEWGHTVPNAPRGIPPPLYLHSGVGVNYSGCIDSSGKLYRYTGVR